MPAEDWSAAELAAYRARMAEIGRKGGRATVAKHGAAHMSRIGKAGFEGLARRLGYAGGHRRGALLFLQRCRGFKRPADLSPAEFEALFESLGVDD